jgi:hypothetical protein
MGNASVHNGEAGVGYGAVQFNASGGSGGFSWTVVSGLPPGLSLSAGGTLSGTPSGPSSGSITVRVTDSANKTAVGTFGPINIAPALSVSPNPPTHARRLQPYAATLTASGGYPGSYSWSPATGTYNGLVVTHNGATTTITGAPLAVGTLVITLTDGYGTVTITIVIDL